MEPSEDFYVLPEDGDGPDGPESYGFDRVLHYKGARLEFDYDSWEEGSNIYQIGLLGTDKILGQLKAETGHILIIDRCSDRRRINLFGLNILIGAPEYQIAYVTSDLVVRYVCTLRSRCVQIELANPSQSGTSRERFNPLIGYEVNSDRCVDLRLLGRGWIRIEIEKEPVKEFRWFPSLCWSQFPRAKSFINGSYGPHYIKIRHLFRLRGLNWESALTLIYYILMPGTAFRLVR